MELKRYELQCSFGRGMYEYKNGKYVKLSDIKKFFGIGVDCEECQLSEMSECGCYKWCKIFEDKNGGLGGKIINREYIPLKRCPDCIKTFGE